MNVNATIRLHRLADELIEAESKLRAGSVHFTAYEHGYCRALMDFRDVMLGLLSETVEHSEVVQIINKLKSQ